MFQFRGGKVGKKIKGTVEGNGEGVKIESESEKGGQKDEAARFRGCEAATGIV